MEPPGDYAISSMAVALGERVIAPVTLAAAYGMSEEAVVESLGDMVVYETSRPRYELAREAAEACLARAGIGIDDVDYLISCQTRARGYVEPPLSRLLGRPQLYTTHLLGTCSVLFRAIWIARAWLRRSAAARRALVVYAETCDDGWSRIAQPHSGRPRDIFSDGAAAVLIEPGRGLALRGFGSDENAQAYEWWLYFDAAAAYDSTLELQILRESTKAVKRALKVACEAAAISFDQLDMVVMPNETKSLIHFLVRHLRIPPERVAHVVRAASHVWAVDPIYSLLEVTRERALPPGHRVLCMVRAVGMAAALALEVLPT